MAPPRDEYGNHRWPPLLEERQWLRVVARFKLSKRQAEVAALLCRECLVDDIARELNISRDAVRHHSKALYRKLAVNSRVGVILNLIHTHHRISNANEEA